MSRVSGAVELVRLMVLRGEVGPGGRIVEVHVAERLGVGRATLREALRSLEGEGLLVADDAGGMHVIELGPGEPQATLQLRAALESLSAGLVATRVREGAVAPAALGDLDELAAAADDVLGDRTFHRALASLSGNHPCRDALTRVWDRIVLASLHGLLGPQVPATREHRELLAAIAAGDGEEAAALASRHVLGPVVPR